MISSNQQHKYGLVPTHMGHSVEYTFAPDIYSQAADNFDVQQQNIENQVYLKAKTLVDPRQPVSA